MTDLKQKTGSYISVDHKEAVKKNWEIIKKIMKAVYETNKFQRQRMVYKKKDHPGLVF